MTPPPLYCHCTLQLIVEIGFLIVHDHLGTKFGTFGALYHIILLTLLLLKHQYVLVGCLHFFVGEYSAFLITMVSKSTKKVYVQTPTIKLTIVPHHSKKSKHGQKNKEKVFEIKIR